MGEPLPPPPASAYGSPLPPPPPPTAGPRSNRNTIAAILAFGGALLLGVATFLPWGELTTSLVRSATVSASGWDWFDNGIHGGPIYALLALGGAALAGLVFVRVNNLPVKIALVGVGVVSLALTIYAATDLLGEKDAAEVIGKVDVSLSYGFYVLLLGALALLAAGIVADHAR